MGRQNRRANCDPFGETALHLKTLNRYWHTIRYLRPVQFYGRLWFRIWHPSPNLKPAPLHSEPSGLWQTPAKRLASMSGPRDFVFLNQPGQLDEIGWDGPQREKLWRYNQHYFDDLNAIDATARLDWHLPLIEDWIAKSPPGEGNGWEPYPTSLRIVNWIKWSLSHGKLSQRALHSLAIQTRWLLGRLEFHLLGNHLFANAKALVFAGLFFQDKESEGWLNKGMQILEKEVPEQILSDGGHFERSTMYHAQALEDLLDLLNISACYASKLSPSQHSQVSDWENRALKMHRWLKAMCHPDDEMSLFNDAAFGIAPDMGELEPYAHHLIPGLQSAGEQALLQLPESGYVRLTHGPAVAILDVAPLGPDYLPGHAHADTLTFELSVHGQRVLVNPGTSCYGNSPERLRQRGTASHNTVTIDGCDSSEVWSGFRVARRASPIELRLNKAPDDSSCEVSCGHNGYHWLPGKPIHHRTWRINENGITIKDVVEGPHQVAISRFHFHPKVDIKFSSGNTKCMVQLPSGEALNLYIEKGQGQLESSTWHPRFGVSLPSTCLVVRLQKNTSAVRFCWDNAHT